MNLGLPEMIFIVLLALVVVGPKRLPEVARKLGKLYGDFKRASNDFRRQLETEMMNIELEERAKKQEKAETEQASAEEKPWQQMILAPEGMVSRGDDGSAVEPKPQSANPLVPTIETTPSSSRPVSSTNA